MTRSAIRFLRRGKVVELSGFPPTRTLLDYLRLDERSRGTKEGCNEGDCGACTVALGRLRHGRLVYEPVNACILLLGQIDGAELVTVEDLAQDGVLHPVQQALVDFHGSQCGFCTPGFVMALWTLYQQGGAPTRAEIADYIAGNLCRCTGYRPIIDAARQSCQGNALDRWTLAAQETAKTLASLQDGRDVFLGDDQSFYAAPASVQSLCDLALKHPDATLVSGATDVGLWITKQMRSLPKIIQLGRAGLDVIQDSADVLKLGATVSYAEAVPHLAGIDPDLGELVRRIGSKQVRASGTIGGNIANGSPIGDMPPALIALGSQLHLQRGGHQRNMPLEEFFIAYGRQAREPGEIVTGADIPKLREGEHFRCYKISKRFDQDISAVMGAFKFSLSGRRITAARIAFGGMAATPKRALAAERALHIVSLDDAPAWSPAIAALAQDYQPISDMRASASYRIETAQALLKKALIEISAQGSQGTRVTGARERAA
jgi:xanthine dehydrogenase small subunit